MSTLPACPECQSPYTYPDGNMLVCPECGHMWNEEMDAQEAAKEAEANMVRDAYGNLLKDGDSVSVIKDLKVRGAGEPIKQGTHVRDIRLMPGEDHDIACRVDGFGAMELKSEFVKKL